MAAVWTAPQAWAADSDSQAFIKKAIEGNLAEVAVGKLAQQKAGSDGVRQFGQMLETDHAQANQKASQVAGTLGVTAPTEPNADQKAMYDKLSSESGTDFDHDFVNGMVTDHKKDIADYQAEAKASDAAGQYATETLPTLQKHLSTAQSLASNTADTAPAATPPATVAAPATTTMAPAATDTPAANTMAPAEKMKASNGPLQSGANSFTEGQAKSRIESAGFSNVMSLKKDDKGIWRGQATKNGATVSVGLDYKGNIATQ